MIKLQSTADVGLRNGVKMLVYGGAGAGKTVLCSTAPAPIILSAESGLLSLRRVRLPYIEIKTLQDLIEAYNWCKSSREAAQFATICLDSISEIAEVVLESEKQRQKDPRKAYFELQTILEKIVRDFRDLPGKHVYFSAKMEATKDGNTGAVMYGPSMPGQKIGPSLPYFFDEVFRLFVGKDPTNNQEFRALRTRPDYQSDAKDRSGMLDELEYPDLSRIIAKIMA